MAPLDDADGIIGFPYGEPGSFAAGLASAVYGHQEVVAAAFHIEGDFPVVAYYDGTDIQAVRRNGVRQKVPLCGTSIGPPTLSEYPVEPVGVAMISPSARYEQSSSPLI